MKEVQQKIYDLWETGISAREVAEQIGISRNAVMGHLFRMRQSGIQMRQKENTVTKRPKITPPPPKRVIGVQKMPRKMPAPRKPTLEEISPPPLAPNGDPVPMIKLSRYSCRYVVNQGEVKSFLFCNAKVKDGSSYCPHHHAICYVPLSNTRPRRKNDDAAT